MRLCSGLELPLHLGDGLRLAGGLELNLGLMLSEGLHLLLVLDLCLRMNGGDLLDLTIGLNLNLGADLGLMQRLQLSAGLLQLRLGRRWYDRGDNRGDWQRLHVDLHRRAGNLRHLLHGHDRGGVLDLHRRPGGQRRLGQGGTGWTGRERRSWCRGWQGRDNVRLDRRCSQRSRLNWSLDLR